MFLRRWKTLYLLLIFCTWQTRGYDENEYYSDDLSADKLRQNPEPKLNSTPNLQPDPKLNSTPNLQPDPKLDVTTKPEPTTTEDEWESYYSESEVEFDPNSKHLATTTIPPPTTTTEITTTAIPTTTTPAPTTSIGTDKAMEIAKNFEKIATEKYDENSQGWSNYWQMVYFGFDSLFGSHYGSSDEYLRTCYFIGTTYQNAITDIRHYFRTRYLYVDNLQYEIGFLTHEIVFKYQTMLEIFHIVQQRFLYNRTRYYAPTPYMLYMYANILDSSKQIIHLCNMMHELEKKYKKHPKTLFQDYHLAKKGPGSDLFKDRNRLAYEHAKLKAAEKKRRQRQLLKQRNKNFRDGVFTRPPKPAKKKNKHSWPLNYGWSIEAIEEWPQKDYPADPRPNPHQKK